MKRVNKNNVIVIGAVILFIVILFVVTLFTTKNTVTITASSSGVTQGAYIRLNNDKYQQKYNLPATIKLREGKYTLYADADSTADLVSQNFTVKFGGTTNVTVTIPPMAISDIGGDGGEIDDSTLTKPTYYLLLPHSTADFRIDVIWKVDGNNIDIDTLTITPTYPDDTSNLSLSDLQAIGDSHVQEAKDWLTKNNIPFDSSTIIDTAY